MKTIILILGLTFCYLESFSQNADTFKDPRDGKVYKIIKIGSQYIMAENFAYKPSNGVFWAYNDDEKNVIKYGYLYDWETANKIAPEGWHLPTKEEWEALYKDLCGNEIVYNEGSKKVGANDFKVYNAVKIGGSSGFEALLGGYHYSGGYSKMNEFGVFWSATANGTDKAWRFYCVHQIGFADINGMGNINLGCSVRLFKNIN